MTNKTVLFATLFASSFFWTACNNDSTLIDPPIEETPEVEEEKETIYPVDFRFITLNNSPSITFVSNEGEIREDYFYTANGFQINENPYCATQIEDRLYLTHGGSFADNGIQQVNPNSFEVINSFDFKRTGRFYAMEHIANDTVVVGGRERGQGYNLMVGSLENEEFMLSNLETGFDISVMKRIGNKLFVAGTRGQSNAVYIEAKLVVFDCDNITEAGMRTIIDDVNLSSNNSPIVIDKNKNIWIAASVGGASAIALYCINPETESIVHQIEFPSHINNYNEYCYTICNEGKSIYLRAYKSFFEIDVDAPITPEDPIYEYTKTSVSVLRDLDMTPEGTLLFIEGATTYNGPAHVVELDPTNEWKEENRYQIDGNARLIYVPKYERK